MSSAVPTPSPSLVHVGLIGSGHFGTAIMAQAADIAALQVVAIADVNLQAAQQACAAAGLDESQTRICDNRTAAMAALEAGQTIITVDPLLLPQLPLHVLVEATGAPHAGAIHASEAIRNGQHVVMVNKETDSVAGPQLAYMAERAGLVYTPADGDQHGLLIQLVQDLQRLGLRILTAGKARDTEFIYDPGQHTVSNGRHTVTLKASDIPFFEAIPQKQRSDFVTQRRRALNALPQLGNYDLCELVIVANATDLTPDVATLHAPVLRTVEIPQVLVPKSLGGILQAEGTVEAVTCLRYPDGAGLGGGVFAVVASDRPYAQHILTSKGCLSNEDGSAALIYRPYHLCGVETIRSILDAGLSGQSTLQKRPEPRFDMIVRASRPLTAGTRISGDHDPHLEAALIPASAVGPGRPIPAHLATNQQLKVDIPSGTWITPELLDLSGSRLWQLRQEQDQRCFPPHA